MKVVKVREKDKESVLERSAHRFYTRMRHFDKTGVFTSHAQVIVLERKEIIVV